MASLPYPLCHDCLTGLVGMAGNPIILTAYNSRRVVDAYLELRLIINKNKLWRKVKVWYGGRFLSSSLPSSGG